MGLTTISMLVVHNLNEELCIFAPLYKDRLFSHRENDKVKNKNLWNNFSYLRLKPHV